MKLQSNLFYKNLEEILLSSTSTEKIKLFEDFYLAYKSDALVFETNFTPKTFEKPSYTDICAVVPPQDVPKRKNFMSSEGQVALLHAIAHIEYSAIDLALDGAYRFSSLPKAYYDDWLAVASDEIRHFLMLEKLLHELDASYGDIEVHNSLFEASQRTLTLVERMAVVPRYLEANGLDATPMILKKLSRLPKNEMITKIIFALSLILEEEVDHVKKGDVWFSYACAREGLPREVYFDIINKYYPRSFLRPNELNIEARKEAGFTCSELSSMAKKRVC